MFYLKYRPQLIQELDNEGPREVLKSVLNSKSLPHAFLFIGQKGTGKTSAARIVAKALNCLTNKDRKQSDISFEPCNVCSNCKSINSSSFPDVVELDAASNRGINEVKELIKEASFLPLVGKYRIFIIDEAHMITNDGFNALLKTLEEPPSTVIFILATTELQKVPKTIVSRCMQINFGKAKKEEIVHMLKRICLGEKIDFEDEVLELIANHSELSFRDATKLLEELVITKKLSLIEARDYIGIKSNQNLLQLVNINPSSPIKALEFIESFAQNGGNFKILIEEQLEELHQALLIESKTQKDLKKMFTFTLKEIVLLMRLFSEAYTNLKYSPIESLPLEIAIVEFYNKRTVK